VFMRDGELCLRVWCGDVYEGVGCGDVYKGLVWIEEVCMRV